MAQKLMAAALAVLMASFGLAALSSGPLAANPAADRCSEAHRFGASPVPVAKTADGATVLAYVEWGYDSSIGCYLSLDQNAATTLRADAVAFRLPTGPVDPISRQCSAVHKFGEHPVPVAKTADGTAILAYIRWLPNDTGACYLVLDNQATTVLRASVAELLPEPDLEVQQNPLSVGDWHSCAIQDNGTVECWGSNWAGQLDAPNGQYTAIAAGSAHTCGLQTDGAVECWGSNATPMNAYRGQADAPRGQFTAIAAGAWHSCAIREDDTIECWGDNDNNQATAPDGRFTAIAAGGAHTCGLQTNGAVRCWGHNWA